MTRKATVSICGNARRDTSPSGMLWNRQRATSAYKKRSRTWSRSFGIIITLALLCLTSRIEPDALGSGYEPPEVNMYNWDKPYPNTFIPTPVPIKKAKKERR